MWACAHWCVSPIARYYTTVSKYQYTLGQGKRQTTGALKPSPVWPFFATFAHFCFADFAVKAMGPGKKVQRVTAKSAKKARDLFPGQNAEIRWVTITRPNVFARKGTASPRRAESGR